MLLPLGALLLLALGFVASAVVLGWPSRAIVGAAPADLHAADVAIPSRSGGAIRGWLVRGEAGSGVVVLLHGIHADRRAMLDRMRFLRDAGYSLLAIDLQAHGESPGDSITFGHLESLDAEAAVAFAESEMPGEKIGVIGVSLGGAAALVGPHPLPVNALVLESVFPDIRSAMANRISAYLGSTAGGFVTSLYLKLMPPMLGVDESQLRPIDHIGEVAAPVFVMSGMEDRYTTIAESRALFARAPDPKQFWGVEGAAHIDLDAHAPEAYRRAVLAFFAEYLRSRVAATPK